MQRVVEHHTHLCPGVLIGYLACKYAVDLIDTSDTMLVTASRAGCGNDAVRVLLNCSEEKGNFEIVAGKGQSWSFYNKEQEEGVTLILNSGWEQQLSRDKDQAMHEMMKLPPHVLFTVQPFVSD